MVKYSTMLHQTTSATFKFKVALAFSTSKVASSGHNFSQVYAFSADLRDWLDQSFNFARPIFPKKLNSHSSECQP